MHPILFDLHLGRLGVFSIGTYGLFYAFGFLLALRLAMSYARRDGLDPSRIVDLCIVALLSGFIGAKLLLYLIAFRTYLADPMAMLRDLRSAGVFYGGFGLACVAVYWYVRKHDLPVGKVADLVSPPLALGQAIGRAGCFMAGCCYGKSCDLPWAITFSDPRAYELTGVTLGVPLHPTQLYHVLADLLILGITAWFMRRRSFAGQVFWIYVLSCALLRFLVEFYRGDSVRGLFFGARLSTSQLIAIPSAMSAALALYLLTRKRSGVAHTARRPGRG